MRWSTRLIGRISPDKPTSPAKQQSFRIGKSSLEDKKGADFDEETGKLSWKINLKSNSSEKIRFGYQVKSDKNQQLYL